MSSKFTKFYLGIIAILVLLTGWSFFSIQKENARLEKELGDSNNKLARNQKEKTDLTNALNAAAEKNQAFATELDKVNQNLDSLRWLNSLDPQLLQKYSKVYFLNENYVPNNLSAIDTKYQFNKSKPIEVYDSIQPFLQKMFQDSVTQNIVMQVASGYRSFTTQASLKSNYKVVYGSGANAFSADQGYSEHQLGTTLDFTTSSVGSGLTGFQKTPAYKWLTENAYKYGFILSYPENNAYYVFEPWHWRFVGLELALKLHNENKKFYDLDQREIDTYLGNMFKR